MLVLRCDPELKAFDDKPLRGWLKASDVDAIREHFFFVDDAPSAPNATVCRCT